MENNTQPLDAMQDSETISLVLYSAGVKRASIESAITANLQCIQLPDKIKMLPDGSLGIDVRNSFEVDWVLTTKAERFFKRYSENIKNSEKLVFLVDGKQESIAAAFDTITELGLENQKIHFLQNGELKKISNSSLIAQRNQVFLVIDQIVGYFVKKYLYEKLHQKYHLSWELGVLVCQLMRKASGKSLEKRYGEFSFMDVATLLKKGVYEGLFSEKEEVYSLSDSGKRIRGELIQNFPIIFEKRFLVRVSELADMVLDSHMTTTQAFHDFWDFFERVIDRSQGNLDKFKQGLLKTSIECSKCSSGEYVLKWGQFGAFYACNRFPACHNTEDIELDVDGKYQIIPKELYHKSCPNCESEMFVRHGQKGRYVACIDYPHCHTTEGYSTELDCPLCSSGELVEKTSRFKKQFYSCNRFPECDFAMWEYPHSVCCMECKFPLMGKKTSKKLGPHLACPRCKEVCLLN
ncbi:MAG: hypothetical protein HOE90_21590 [Bacteriovoracaceae bacterium]|jgi:ssDNA-binding Zn-finger/Zn-ribbon topoisomerase 1|nr:hypothetical protein [Bacteriovoracaceae bacterium]